MTSSTNSKVHPDSTTVESLMNEIDRARDSVADALDDADQALGAMSSAVSRFYRLAEKLARGYQEQARDSLITDRMLDGLKRLREQLNDQPMRGVVINSNGDPHNFNKYGEVTTPFFKSRWNLALRRAAETTGLCYSPDMGVLVRCQLDSFDPDNDEIEIRASVSVEV